jgi:hypothetical protein
LHSELPTPVVSRNREVLCRRAVDETSRDSLGLSATIRSFSTSVQCGRRPVSSSEPTSISSSLPSRPFEPRFLSSLLSGLDRTQDEVLMLMGIRIAHSCSILRIACRTVKNPDLPLGRSDIADFLCLSREAVCRILAQLTCNKIAQAERHLPIDR